MTTIVLDIILGVSVLSSLLAVRLSSQLMYLIRVKMGVGVALLYLALSMASAACWIWLAFLTGYWQLAAMAVASFIIARAGSLARTEAKR